jgi:hypothetical protein
VIRRAVEAFRLDAGRRALAGEAAALRAARAELEEELGRLGRRLEEALRAFRAVQAVRQDKLDPRLDALLPRGDLLAAAAEPDGGQPGSGA